MEQTDPSRNNKEIAAIADYLKSKEDVILQKWKRQTQHSSRENSDQAESLSSLSLDKFFNSFPLILENIGRVLSDHDSNLDDLARKHGNERWEYGFDLRLVTEEWGRLHVILIKQLQKATDSLSVQPQVMWKLQNRLADFMHASIQNSVNEFYNLQQLKAHTKMQGLETIINTNKAATTKRGKSLQQVSHDVGGSMVALKLNLKFLKKLDLSAEAIEIVDQVSISAKNLSQLLDNLLDLFRLEAGREKLEIEKFDASELLQDLGDNIQSLAEAQNLELLIDGPDSLEVDGDAIKVKRIAQNLLLNSLKYTKEGQIELNWDVQDHNHWVININDTGPGMDVTTAALFTDEDYTSDVSVSDEDHGPEEVEMHSEGIGLLIVRQLCQLLKAVVDVKIKPNEGTHFEIVLPRKYNGKG